MTHDDRPDWPPRGYLTPEQAKARIQEVLRRLREAVEQWGEDPPQALAEALAAATTEEEAARVLAAWIAPLLDELELIQAAELQEVRHEHGAPDAED